MRSTARICQIVSVVLLATVAWPALAERGDDSKRKSKNGKTSGTIDGVEVTLEYGRPNVKGRTIWGSLVPHGKVWRTGADEATTISFSRDVMVERERLSAGRYGLFTIPDEGEWVFIFNKVPDQWGAFNYEAGQDALRVRVAPREADHVESMGFMIDGSAVVLRWEKLAVAFELAAAG